MIVTIKNKLQFFFNIKVVIITRKQFISKPMFI